MKIRNGLYGLIALCGLAAHADAQAQQAPPRPQQPAPPPPTCARASLPGWTGITNPKDVITARQELMEHIEILMEPIDTITVKDVVNPDQLRANAATISAMLLAVPHLFPPTTNLYDPKAEMPKTLALPPIWKNFESFYTLAASAASAAEAMEQTTTNDPQTLRAASLRLRASCDSCHVLFLRKYEPPKVRDSDVNFDFESALGKK